MNKKLVILGGVLGIIIVGVAVLVFTRDNSDQAPTSPDTNQAISQTDSLPSLANNNLSGTLDSSLSSTEEYEEYIDDYEVIISLADQTGANAGLISSNAFLDNTINNTNICRRGELPLDVLNYSNQYLSVAVYSVDQTRVIYRVLNINPNTLISPENLSSANQLPCINLGSNYRLVASLHPQVLSNDVSYDELTSYEFTDFFDFSL